MRARRTALALCALLVATACPDRTPQPNPTARPSVRRGGSLTLAYPWEPATLDPFTIAGDSPATRDLTRLVMPALYRLGPAGERQLWLLAEEPTTSSAGGGFSVTFALRDDATWSDGSPVTVADVRATWRRALAGPRSVRDGYDKIRRIVSLSSKRARIEFARPYRRWQDLFSAGLGVVPARAGSLADAWRLSGGAFRLRSWRRGLDLTFVRNARAVGGVTQLDRLRVVFVPDATTAIELLRTKKVDMLGPYLSPDWTRRADEVGDVTSDTSATWAGMLMNTSFGPLRARAVRAAMLDAFDRPRIAAGLIGSEGEPLDALDPQGSPNVPPPSFDAQAAARALDRAGWRGEPVRTKDGARLSFTIAVASNDDLGQIVARSLEYRGKRIGVQIESVPLSPGELWLEWLPSTGFQSALVIWRDPPGGAARARFGSARSANRARIRDATLDRALTAADEGEGANLADLERALRAAAPVVPLWRVKVSLATVGVCGARASASADGPFWNAGEWLAGPCA